MADTSLVVMAAGIGSRYGGLKQIDPVGPNGEVIIEYSIYDALRAGFDEVIFVVKKEIGAVFRKKVGSKIESHCKVTYVYQRMDLPSVAAPYVRGRQKPWGTAHAILSCKDVVNTPFAVINADDFYGHSSYQLLYDYLEKSHENKGNYCMIGYILENTLTNHGSVARGVCKVDENGFLIEIHERLRLEQVNGAIHDIEEDGETWTALTKNSIVSMNMWGFTPDLFGELEARFPHFLNAMPSDKAEFLLPQVVHDLLKEKKATVRVIPTQEHWFGVTYQEDKPRVRKNVQELVQRGIYPHSL